MNRWDGFDSVELLTLWRALDVAQLANQQTPGHFMRELRDEIEREHRRRVAAEEMVECPKCAPNNGELHYSDGSVDSCDRCYGSGRIPMPTV